MRIVTAAAAALLFSVVFLQDSPGVVGATPGSRPSVNVAVVPGFVSPTYPGYYGIPKLPVTDPQLAKFHFTALPAQNVNPAKLKQFDTVILYGKRWNTLSATAQQSINAFAATGKVVIWDADDTGPQNYATFIHPFSNSASGENGKANDSVVSFPGGENFLASSNPSSPYYLDPKQLVSNKNMINDMNAMKTGTPGWTPALVGANKNIPNGGWPLAWAYGVVPNHTGMTIYSGIDADAFADKVSPNYAIKELRLQLEAPFFRTPDPSCAPTCQPPNSSKGPRPFASCSFAKRVPRGWVHGRISIWLKTSVAAGIRGKVQKRSGKVLASGRENSHGIIRMRLQTRLLPSGRTSRLRAAVYVHGQKACSKNFRLKVNNP